MLKNLRFRFSLRTFLIFVLVLSTAIGWLIFRVDRQRRAIAIIEQHGGSVFYEYRQIERGWSFDRNASTQRNELYSRLFRTVTEVSIDFYGYTDEFRQAIIRLPTIRRINVGGHDSAFGRAVIQEDFPKIDVVDNQKMYW